MRTLGSALLCALVLAVAVAATDAAGETLEIPDFEYGFRATWTSLEVEAVGVTIRCPITLEGSFAQESIPAVVRSAVGAVTNASLPGACTGGSASVARETLPWHVQYNGFTGVLPNIAGIRLRLPDAHFIGSFAGIVCRLSTTDAEPLKLTANLSNAEVTSVDAEPLAGIRLEGGVFCPVGLAYVRGRTGPLATQSGNQVVHMLQNPDPNFYAVAVGDSYISGEGGRWAGNTNGASSGIDRDGPTAYLDNDNRTAELVPGCHREIYSSAIRLVGPGGLLSRNFACSGAITRTTRTPEGRNKPGLDFPADGSASQLTELKRFAEDHRHRIRMVVVSIGGNNFHFGDIVTRCGIDYSVNSIPCRTDPYVTAFLTAARVAENQAEIRRAIEEVHLAMQQAGNLETEYTIMVMGYPRVLPENGFRYAERLSRTNTGKCPIYESDAEWANATLVTLINETIWNATKQLPFINFRRLNVINAFVGRRLCENTVRLLEEIPLPRWRDQDGIDRMEWVTQIRALDSGERLSQESLHPNGWGQRALRSCLRQAYNNGAPQSVSCLRVAGLNGKDALGEPWMTVYPFNP